MKVLVISFSKAGALLSKKVKELYKDQAMLVSTKEQLGSEFHYSKDIKEQIRLDFEKVDLIIFIGATGIAVRMMAPFLKDKYTDPAVLVMDETGKYVIALLSGHLGGANQYAKELANYCGSIPVITTASEQYELLAPDLFAQREGLVIQNRNQAKIASAFLNEHLRISIFNQTGYDYAYPKEYQKKEIEQLKAFEPSIGISYQRVSQSEDICTLVPKVLSLGVGCRKGVSFERIREAVSEIFDQEGLFLEAVREIATIDLKKEEPGLLQFASFLGVSVSCYTADELLAVPGEFNGSSFVASITGVDNICERAAVKASDDGKLLIEKHSKNGVTVAVAIDKGAMKWEN